MNSIKVLPGRVIEGSVRVPSSKSMGHRALICAALSDGLSTIRNINFSKDIEATCSVLTNLGKEITFEKDKIIVSGSNKITPTGEELFCEESGSTIRFLIPVALLQDLPITFNGKGKLVERPLSPYYDIFKLQNIDYSNNNGMLPLKLHGRLHSGTFRVRGDISSQFISGLLFALPLLEGDSVIEIEGILESKPYVDLTIAALSDFGVIITNNDYKSFSVKGNQFYRHREYSVEGDYSQAAFFIAAGLLNGTITCENLNHKSLQGDKAFVDIVKRMGGKIVMSEGCVTAFKSELKGIKVDVSEIPDIVPILAVLAATSSGTTEIYNASRLRIKECDRLHAVSAELNRIGAKIIEKEDSLIIEGVESLKGGIVDSYNDHRIVMAMSIASLKCREPIVINNYEAVDKSYPHFFQDLNSIGGQANECSMGD